MKEAITAEHARQITAQSHEARVLEARTKAGEIALSIDQKAVEVLAQCHVAITEAASRAEDSATTTYSERISKRTRTPQEVDAIELFASEVADRVIEDLLDDGFHVSAKSVEAQDFRQQVNEPAEYYETAFHINW